MSEYMEKHAVSKLIGAPPGYVGFDEVWGSVRGQGVGMLARFRLQGHSRPDPECLCICLCVWRGGQWATFTSHLLARRFPLVPFPLSAHLL